MNIQNNINNSTSLNINNDINVNSKPPISPSSGIFKITSTQVETTRTICITRNETGYGFTLSRYVLYPNSNLNSNNDDACLSKQSIEIVFIKHVRSDSVAYLAGLREGDRPIRINNVSTSDKTYSQIIALIENSGKYLELVVIPSEQQKQQLISNTIQPLQVNDSNKKLLLPSSKLILSSDDYDNSSSNHEVYNINFKASSPLSISSSTITSTTFNSPTQAISPSISKANQSQHSSSPPIPLPPPQPPPLATATLITSKPPLSQLQTQQQASSGGFFDYHKMSNYKPEKLSPLTQLKLRRLQESLIERYTKEELNELGIVIPNLNDSSSKYSPRKTSQSISNLQEQIIRKQHKLISERTLSANSSVSSVTASPPSTTTTTTTNLYQQQQQILNNKLVQQQQSPLQSVKSTSGQSPALFSQYIESVHRALNESYYSGNSLNDSTNYFTNYQPSSMDSLMSKSPASANARLVKNRQKIFEQPHLLENSFNNVSQQNMSHKFPRQNSLTSEQSFKNLQPLPQQQQQQQQQQTQQQQQSTLIPINFIHNTIAPNQQQNANVTNKYGEVKKLMQTGLIETIAERAAHFEEVDPEKYNRIKNKYLINEYNDHINSSTGTYQHNLTHVSSSSNRTPPQSSFYRQIQQQQYDDWKYERPHIARYYTASNLITNENMNRPSGPNDDYNSQLQQQQQQTRSLTSSSSPSQLNTSNYSQKNNINTSTNTTTSSSITQSQQNASNNLVNNNNNNNNNKTSLNNTTNARGGNMRNNRVINSDAASSSSDSEEGASSSPSSPRRISHLKHHKHKQQHQESPAQRALNAQIIRQHSYLNAVRTNDDYAIYTHKFNPKPNHATPAQFKQQAYSQSSTNSRDQETISHDYFGRKYANTKVKMLSSLTQDDDIQEVTTDQEDSKCYLQRSKKQSNKKHSTSTSTISPVRSPISGDDEPRRNSSIQMSVMNNNLAGQSLLDQQQMHQKPQQQNYEPVYGKPPQPSSLALITNKLNKEIKLATPQPSRNTSIKKLKSFFGEKTPIVLQAVENKNIIASDSYLNTMLETIKEGVLNCKMVLKDGKRSNDRSWKPAWAVLKKNGGLFLCKEKRDNIMIPSVDSYPINLKSATIYVAHDYVKRRNVFKVITFNGSEYLFQTVDNDSMNEWINAMTDNSPQDKFIASQQQQQQSQVQLMSNEPFNRRISTDSYYEDLSKRSQVFKNVNKSSTDITNTAYHNESNNYESIPLTTFNQQQSSCKLNEDMQMHDLNLNVSPLTRSRKDSSPRRDSNNRKWVRQVTRRIKDFMNSAPSVDASHEFGSSSIDYSNSLNFGIPLSRCEVSSISDYIPVVVEICTSLIELHIIDEGLYRKVGQKITVNSLRAQINKGVKFMEVTDSNWDNPHVVVSLLKCFLNELPDSLITKNLYSDFIQVCRIDHHHERLISIRKLLRQLPVHNFETMKYLCAHLRKVAAFCQQNKMTIKNISISFSQSIVRLNEASCETIKTDHLQQALLVELLLTYYEWIFDQAEQFESVPNEMRDTEAQLHIKLESSIESTNFTELLSNILKALRVKWQILNDPKQNEAYNRNQEQSRQLLNIQFKSHTCNEILRNSKSVGSITIFENNNLNNEIKPKEPLSNTYENRTKSFITFSSTKNETKLKKSVSKIKTNAKLKRRSKHMIQQMNGEDDEKYAQLSETVRAQLQSYKELERQNQLERERLNEIIRKLDTDIILAKIDMLKNKFSSSDSSTALDHKRTKSFVLPKRSSRAPFVKQPHVSKIRRRYTISSVDHLIENKENISQEEVNKIRQNQLIHKPTADLSKSQASSISLESTDSATLNRSDNQTYIKLDYSNENRPINILRNRMTKVNFQYESLI